MKRRLCPYCKEKIKRAAVVCRYCQREVPVVRTHRRRTGLVPALMAVLVIASGSAFLVSEFLKERRYWLNE